RALEAEPEDALVDGCGRVERGDDLVVAVELKDAADERSRDGATEEAAGDGHADRVDPGDRELALGEEHGLDPDALDAAGDRHPGYALDPGHGGGQDELEVGRATLDVVPPDAQLGDPDRQEARPLEGVAGGRTDAEEDAEAREALE